MKSTRTTLSARQRCCVFVAALFALNRRTEAYSLLRKTLPRSAFPILFLQELFIHLSLVLGFPAMLEGLEFLKHMRPDAKRGGTRMNVRGQKEGKRILKRIYGGQTEKLLDNIGEIHSQARSMIVHDVYGRVFSRPGLTLKERELINVTVLAIQGLDRQLHSHVRGCLRVGVEVTMIRETLSLVQRISKRNMQTARTLLRLVVSQRKKL